MSENRLKKFPYQIKFVDPETNARLLEDFTGERTGFVQVGPEKWFFPSGYAREAGNIYNLQPRSTDVWIVTFPRSGTTWTQEMVWLLANDMNYKKAKDVPLIQRFPFLEFNCFMHPELKQEFLDENWDNPENLAWIETLSYPVWKVLEKMDDRRFIKTHLPFELLPPNLLNCGCKVIYIARNPKDVAVSFYHLNRSIRTQGYQRDFSRYWYYFRNNLQPWTPYWSHIKDAWQRRHNTNLLFLFYEDMVANLSGAIRQINQFIGGKNYNNLQLATLQTHLQIDNFRSNRSVNFDIMKRLAILRHVECFVRKGGNGGWRDYFNNEIEMDANEWIRKNLENTDLIFPQSYK